MSSSSLLAAMHRPQLVVATATELARYTRQHLIAAQTALARTT
jgi:hypothetical protein